MKRKKIITTLVCVILSGMLLCGCGGNNTEADKKTASLEQEQEKEKSKNEKEEKQSEQSSKTTESRESSSNEAEASVIMSSASAGSSETQAKDSEEEKQSSQSPSKDMSEKILEYADANVGDTITFGHYEQDNDTTNGAEEIEWIVLAKEEDKMLVISQYALECQPYNIEDTDVTWEVCTLRNWLNESFYNTVFTGKEQGKIVTITNENPDTYEYYNSDYAVKSYGKNKYTEDGWGAKGGNDTSDKVFCLSYEEALSYFASDEARRCTPTAYVVARGAWTGEADSTVRTLWWLRSPGHDQSIAMDVSDSGSLGCSDVYLDFEAVRPALWISTK